MAGTSKRRHIFKKKSAPKTRHAKHRATEKGIPTKTLGP